MCALFVPLSNTAADLEARAAPPGEREWNIERAEQLLTSLTGVLSSRVVAKPGGEIEEIHVLTTTEVSPKQTVRNVESALLADFDLEVDHRKISVAQTSQRTKEPGPQARVVPDDDRGAAAGAQPAPAPQAEPAPRRATEERIIFLGHEFASDGPRKIRLKVAVEWADSGRAEGEAVGTDLPKSRVEAAARATLQALEACAGLREECDTDFTLALDGVRLVDAFEGQYVLVSVHAITGRDATPLVGSASVRHSPERAVILATLQATDRWVRGRVNSGP